MRAGDYGSGNKTIGRQQEDQSARDWMYSDDVLGLAWSVARERSRLLYLAKFKPAHIWYWSTFFRGFRYTPVGEYAAVSVHLWVFYLSGVEDMATRRTSRPY